MRQTEHEVPSNEPFCGMTCCTTHLPISFLHEIDKAQPPLFVAAVPVQGLTRSQAEARQRSLLLLLHTVAPDREKVSSRVGRPRLAVHPNRTGMHFLAELRG